MSRASLKSRCLSHTPEAAASVSMAFAVTNARAPTHVCVGAV